MILSTAQTAGVTRLAERARNTFPLEERQTRVAQNFSLNAAPYADLTARIAVPCVLRIEVFDPSTEPRALLELQVEVDGSCDERKLERLERAGREEAKAA